MESVCNYKHWLVQLCNPSLSVAENYQLTIKLSICYYNHFSREIVYFVNPGANPIKEIYLKNNKFLPG